MVEVSQRKAKAIALCRRKLMRLIFQMFAFTNVLILDCSAERLIQPEAMKVVFAPNQLAALNWYKPLGSLINGHMAETFANSSLWPQLRKLLQINHGIFAISAAEIGFMSAIDFASLRGDGIGVSVEVPAWTQCEGGEALARAELYGEDINGKDLFATTFSVARSDARGFSSGWFLTRDGVEMEPDEVVLDHRIGQLMPRFDLEPLLSEGRPWETRKAIARHQPCPFSVSPSHRLEQLISDYVSYAKLLQVRFKSHARLSFHWNVNPGSEWRDENWLNKLHARHPDASSFRAAYLEVEQPLFQGTDYLTLVVDRLCREVECPYAVYMDMGLTYNMHYTLEALARNKIVLNKRGVRFGVDLADECNGRPRCYLTVEKDMLVLRADDRQRSENLLAQISLINKLELLLSRGIVDRSTLLRIQSWSTRPFEIGNAVGEQVPGSFANTTLRVFDEFLIPRGWARRD